MALIEANRKEKPVLLDAQVAPEVLKNLKNYIRFSGAGKDEIVAGALKRLFEDDTEFAAWLEKRPSRKKRRDNNASTAGDDANE